MRVECDDDFLAAPSEAFLCPFRSFSGGGGEGRVEEFLPRSLNGFRDGGRMVRIIVIHESAEWRLALVFKSSPRALKSSKRFIGASADDIGKCRECSGLGSSGINAIEFAHLREGGHIEMRVIDDFCTHIFEDRRDVGIL